ncbi:MAG: mannose-1-phosphate guanylyltransferase/mannose-6-phosphate isomerase [Nitrospiraceae bacterium]|nr:mannose-1-phosphate guanylyltransferase/mannose-6-phosphate isomerase [Nitrospiraceae bacterium]
MKKKKSGNSDMYAVILAGGSGTRFWPLSRETTPKQMLRVFGDRTMIQQTTVRLRGLVPDENVVVVTGRKYAFDIRKQIADVCDLSKFHILVEPEGRNTAPAIGLAAVKIKKKDPSAVMVVMPADHVILNDDRFRLIVREAADLAEEGYLTTFGIVPHRPETGYGYIQKGAAIRGTRGVQSFKVRRFVEKPDLEKAGTYVSSGNYFWNSGIFIWRVRDILAEMKRQMPDLYKGLLEIEKAVGSAHETDVIGKVFKGLPSVSIDYGIMENAAKVAVLPADMGWSDVGSWRALDEISEMDRSGNIISGNVIDIDSKDSIVYGGRRLVATIGLDNMVVVDTPDATLICSKDRTQDVRKVVDELKKKGADELIEHVTVERPWGSYTVLETGARYKIKRLVVNPGARLSVQMHHHRSEHWVVVSGTARVSVGDKTYNVHPNESTFVPVSQRHRLENPGRVPLEMIEVQSGDYMGEDDIIRFDDEYGRHEA